MISLLKNPLTLFSIIVLLILLVLAIFPSQIAPMDPQKANYDALRSPPSKDHLMGTDYAGRDVASRVIYGVRTTLIIAFSAVILSKTIGFVWGLASGYFGGWFDLITERIVEIMLSIPGLILALLLLAGLGSGKFTVIIAIAVGGIAGTVRIIRAQVLSVKSMAYVEAAKAMGVHPLIIIFRHVAPQCVAPLLIVASASLGGAIFAEAGLSFLGLGITPNEPTWGSMMSVVAENYLRPLWWIAIFPGIALTFTIMAFNLIGDELRDRLDPRLKGEMKD
ncbi:MAG: peptide ABC transporter permease [Dehalococcoidia bacterium]|nr:peptide ABC transporter permease [Dehalococcoidia bacterium]|tara:strand:- start:2769 stop:3602 length:834 start_codon:yes stop_codon:yes gene_type:complete